ARLVLQGAQGLLAAIGLAVDGAHGDEDEVLEMPREQRLDPLNGMHADSAVRADEKHRGRLSGVDDRWLAPEVAHQPAPVPFELLRQHSYPRIVAPDQEPSRNHAG